MLPSLSCSWWVFSCFPHAQWYPDVSVRKNDNIVRAHCDQYVMSLRLGAFLVRRNLDDFETKKWIWNWTNRKLETRRSSVVYFGGWFGRVCGAGWGCGACRFSSFDSARFVTRGGGGFESRPHIPPSQGFRIMGLLLCWFMDVVPQICHFWIWYLLEHFEKTFWCFLDFLAN